MTRQRRHFSPEQKVALLRARRSRTKVLMVAPAPKISAHLPGRSTTAPSSACATTAAVPCRGGPAAEEHSGSNDIVLMRHGAFCKHFGRRIVTADLNQAVFFSKDRPIASSIPPTAVIAAPFSPPRRACSTTHPRTRSLQEQTTPERPFPSSPGPCDAGVFWRHRQLVQRWRPPHASRSNRSGPRVTALQLIAART